MAFVTHTVTGDLRQMFGADIDTTQVVAKVETNLTPGMVMVYDLDNETQRLGSGDLTINPDGTWTLSGVPSWDNTEADQNPTHVQIQVRFEYVDKVTRQRTKYLTGFLQIDHDGSIGGFVAQQLAPADWRSDFMDQAEGLLAQQQQISGLTGEDDAVAALVGTPSSDTAVALATSIDSRVLSLLGSRRVAGAGDSITVGSGASSASRGYINQAQKVAGSAYAFIKTNGGVAGERSDQILARVPAILATGIDHMHIQCGTNDASQSITLAAFSANIQAMVALGRAAGVSMSIGLVPPRGSGAASGIHNLIVDYNMWISLWAPGQGLTVADTFTPLADVNGYLAAANDSGDGTHPSNAGHLLMAREVGPAIISRHLGAPWPVTGINRRGLIGNPIMSSTTGWSSRGTTGSGTPDIDTEAPIGGDLIEHGNWLVVELDNTANATASTHTRGYTLDPAGYSAGHVLGIWGKMDANLPAAKLQITNNDVAFAIAHDMANSVENPGPILAAFTVPASPGTLRAALSLSAAAHEDVLARLGECNVFNLTTGGLVNVVAA